MEVFEALGMTLLELDEEGPVYGVARSCVRGIVFITVAAYADEAEKQEKTHEGHRGEDSQP